MLSQNRESYLEVKERLDQIVDAVSVDDLPLDDTLALYEEAVKLGLRASDLIEQDMEARRAEEEAAYGISSAAGEVQEAQESREASADNAADAPALTSAVAGE